MGAVGFTAASPVESGDLTVTLQLGEGYELGAQSEVTVEIVAADPAITIRAVAASHEIAEDGGTQTVTLRAETDRRRAPAAQFHKHRLEHDAGHGDGRRHGLRGRRRVCCRSTRPNYTQSGTRWVAEKQVEVAIVDDTAAEGTERLFVTLARRGSTNRLVKLANTDGTLCEANEAGVNCGAEIRILDDERAAGSPDAPAGLTATAQAGGTVELSWTAPTDVGNGPITGYRIEWSADGAAPWTALEDDTASTGTRFTDDDIADGATRHYRVFAINAIAAGPPSAAVPGTADGTPPAFTSGSVNAAGDTITLVFDSVLDDAAGRTPLAGAFTLSAADGAQIEVGAVTVSGSARTVALGALTTPASDPITIKQGQVLLVGYTDPDPAEDDAAVIQDEAGNDVRNFSNAALTNDSTEPPTVPGAVTLSAEPFGTDGIRLTWIAPADTGGRAVTGYYIEWSADGTDGSWEELVDLAGNVATFHTDSPLADGTVRHYRVRAITGAGNGVFSDPLEQEVDSALPGQVTDLEATPDGGTRIDLEWMAPSRAGDSAISGYRIEWSPDGTDDSWDDLVADTGNTDTTYSDTMNLASETTRHYRVSAINGEGTGRASEPVSATTDDIMEPSLVRSRVDGDLLVLTYDEPLDEGSTPTPSRYTIRSAGSPAAVATVEIRGTMVRLTLAMAVETGATVTLEYSVPSSNLVQDVAGNPAASISPDNHG